MDVRVRIGGRRDVRRSHERPFEFAHSHPSFGRHSAGDEEMHVEDMWDIDVRFHTVDLEIIDTLSQLQILPRSSVQGLRLVIEAIRENDVIVSH